MNRPLLALGAFALLLLVWWNVAPGGDQPPAGGDQQSAALAGIAVIDIERVFREHRPFQEGVERIRQELQQTQQTIAVRQVEIEDAQRRLQGLRPGTPEHEQARLLLSRLQAELQSLAERQKLQFANQEMALYTETYARVAAAVEQYARSHGIRLVLRSHESAVNPEDRNSVFGAVGRAVVFQEGLDITAAIVEQLSGS